MVLKDSIYWRIFGEIWSYFKRHMEADQIDWQKAVDEARAFGCTYENTPQFPLVKALIFAAQDEMERVDVRKTDNSNRRQTYREEAGHERSQNSERR